MNKDYKLVLLIVLMLLILSFVLSILNYKTTLKLVHSQIQEQSLPLSLDNIYTDIQEHILRPYLVTSMMANDTFVKEWIEAENIDELKIGNYLKTVKNEYELLSAILVSDKTKNYYTQDGFLEKLSKNNRDNSWYFRFKNSEVLKEINIDKNEKIDSEYIMFLNYKIYKNEKLIGITSTGVRIDSINKMLSSFVKKYHLEVYIYDKDANIVLSRGDNSSLEQIDEFKKYKIRLLKKSPDRFEYTLNNDRYIINKKYIKELDLHILVKANVKDFTGSLENTFYTSVFVSFIMTVLIALVIIYIVRTSLKKLEKSNEQKDMLLKEVHHRVKNNLNIIGSILGLQAIQEKEYIRFQLLKTKYRIDAISAVHEMLYKHEDFKEIKFCEYIQKIKNLSWGMLSEEKKFQLVLKVDKELTFPLDTMVQFGLMINEMFTNTVKYAQNSEGLKVFISLKQEKNSLDFCYRDNSMSVDMQNVLNSKGLGTKLINICVRQLNGELSKHNHNGLVYEIKFKI